MIKKIFLTSFAVQLVTYVTTIIGMTVDGIVTGSFLGTNALAAYGLVTPLLIVLTAIPSAISAGTSTVVSIELGKGDLKEMNRVFRICFWTTLLISLLITAVLFIFASPIASALGAEGEVHTMVIDYLKGYSIGFPAIFLVVLLIPILQLIGKRSTLVVGIVVMTAVNISIDFFNAFVWHKGMFGMAAATTLSYAVALVIVLRVLLSKNVMISVSPVKLDTVIIKEMASYGLPNAVSMGCRNTLTIIINHLIISIAGINMVAAYTSVMSAMALAMSIGIGMSATVSMLSGVFSGEKDRQDLVELMKLSIRYSIIVNGVCSVIFIIFARPIISLFLKGDTQILSDAVTGLRVIVLDLILFSINFCIRSYYQTMKIRLTIPYAVFNCLISTAVLAFILGHTIGIIGVWIAYPLSELITLLLFGAIALNKMKPDGRRSFLERFLLIPNEYYNDVEPIELSVNSEEDAVKASEKVNAYMKENGSDNKTALFAALAVEELTVNIIRYGFSENTSNNISLKLKKDDSEWILRIRDDCRNFDPVAYIKGITPEQKESHYGIRMIYSLSEDIKYLNTFNLNNLLIRFKLS